MTDFFAIFAILPKSLPAMFSLLKPTLHEAVIHRGEGLKP